MPPPRLPAPLPLLTPLLLASAALAQGPAASRPAGAAARPDTPARPRPERLQETVVTATRTDDVVFDVPYMAYVLDRDRVQNETLTRSTPQALAEVPEVMGQKTAYGQGSPFLRGFTGYNTLFMIDGIRLNNSTMRSGPNQYWATVDSFSYDRMEVVMGPASALYGSDAVGGVVQVFTNRRHSFEPGVHSDFRTFARYGSAENSVIGRIEGSSNVDDTLGLFAGVTGKNFGDLTAGGGAGTLEYTGYSEFDGDFHADVKLGRGVWLTGAYQRVKQNDVPRTHTTIYAVPFDGTTVGTEKQRQQDQERDLLYGRLTRADGGDSIDREVLTAYLSHQYENRSRIVASGASDFESFEVWAPGVQAQITRDTSLGKLTGGVEYQHDSVNSRRQNVSTAGVVSEAIQGSVGDNGGYDLLGVYAQDQARVGRFEFVPGVRLTYAHAYADQVDNPAVPGSNPATPGNIIGVNEDWWNVSGNLRALYHATEDLNVFAGASQGFRAPSLADLTSFDETSAIEFPTPGLEPEKYLQLEAGVKARGETWSAQGSYWYTFINGGIVASPTGQVVGTTPVVAKSNVGDGWNQGLDAQGAWNFAGPFSAFAWAAWNEGEQDQVVYPTGGGTPFLTRTHISRAMPLSGLLGFRVDGEQRAWFAEVVTRGMTTQDKLSLKDRTDTQRIPPGGTPGWWALGLRGGVKLHERVMLNAEIANVTNTNYRIHGSGVNESGINFVVGIDFRF